MIYHAYDAYEQILAPLRWLAQEVAYYFAQPWPGMREGGWPASWPATLSVMAQARLTHARPEFGINRVMIGSREVAIREEIALRRRFCTLLHLQRFEAWLGTSLFRRTTWEDGETYLEAARAALRGLNEAEVALAARGDELVGRVRVISRSVHKT
jgi:hypothetical protein